MFGIGWTEFIVIAIVLLIFVGPKNLPPLLRKFGQFSAELENASRELRSQLDSELEQIESPKQIIREISEDILANAALPYEEAAQADRELRQEAAALKNSIQGEPSPEQKTADSDDLADSPSPTEKP